jgi:hypothetical protein
MYATCSLGIPISLRVKLHFSTAYHPQTYGQQCLENYPRNMAFLQPKKWHHWLALAQWWYNTTFHTTLRMTPFQAIYGGPPPQIAERYYNLKTLELISNLLLLKLLNRLSKPCSKQKEWKLHRSETQLQIGDMVYLKLHTCGGWWQLDIRRTSWWWWTLGFHHNSVSAQVSLLLIGRVMATTWRNCFE